MDLVPLDASAGVRTNSLLYMRGRHEPGPSNQGVVKQSENYFAG